MSLPTSFGLFNANQTKTKPIIKEAEECKFIPVGGQSFHALAVTLIDKIKHSPIEYNELCKKILDAYHKHYPKLVPHSVLALPAERLKLLIINTGRMIDLVESLSDVLKQLALDEAFASPQLYPEIFEGLTPDTLKSTLRESNTLPAAALRALAASLNIKISLSLVEPEKQIRGLEIFDEAPSPGKKLSVHLQVLGKRYFPEVSHKDLFRYVGKIKSSVKRWINNEDNEGTIKPCLDKIDLHRKMLLNSYNLAYKSLVNLELTNEDLMALFAKFFPVKHRSIPDETYLLNLGKTNDEPQDAQFSDEGNDPKRLTKLATWVATKQVQKDAFFLHIEESVKNNRPSLRNR